MKQNTTKRTRLATTATKTAAAGQGGATTTKTPATASTAAATGKKRGRPARLQPAPDTIRTRLATTATKTAAAGQGGATTTKTPATASPSTAWLLDVGEKMAAAIRQAIGPVSELPAPGTPNHAAQQLVDALHKMGATNARARWFGYQTPHVTFDLQPNTATEAPTRFALPTPTPESVQTWLQLLWAIWHAGNRRGLYRVPTLDM